MKLNKGKYNIEIKIKDLGQNNNIININRNTINMINLSEDKWSDETEFRGGSSPVLNLFSWFYLQYMIKIQHNLPLH